MNEMKGTNPGANTEVEGSAAELTTKASLQLAIATASLDDKWLEAFYKECGRETTLAYTTLNQMKNWAMVVVAAAISGLSFGTSSDKYPNPVMFTGVVIVYVFVLRFFIRSIICYINLLRWNRLQADCVALKLLPGTRGDDSAAPSKQELEEKLKTDINHYYHGWRATINRKSQLFQNLKLGFALLFALPLFFIIQGAFRLWGDPLVEAMLVFALGATFVEFNDFAKSSYFDDLDANRNRRTKGGGYEIFPVPATRGWYLLTWVANLILSVGVAERHAIWTSLVEVWRLICGPGR
jgi:hypothetical protein